MGGRAIALEGTLHLLLRPIHTGAVDIRDVKGIDQYPPRKEPQEADNEKEHEEAILR